MPFSYPPSEVPVDINDIDDIFKEYNVPSPEEVAVAAGIVGIIIAGIILGSMGVAA